MNAASILASAKLSSFGISFYLPTLFFFDYPKKKISVKTIMSTREKRPAPDQSNLTGRQKRRGIFFFNKGAIPLCIRININRGNSV